MQQLIPILTYVKLVALLELVGFVLDPANAFVGQKVV